MRFRCKQNTGHPGKDQHRTRQERPIRRDVAAIAITGLPLTPLVSGIYGQTEGGAAVFVVLRVAIGLNVEPAAVQIETAEIAKLGHLEGLLAASGDRTVVERQNRRVPDESLNDHGEGTTGVSMNHRAISRDVRMVGGLPHTHHAASIFEGLRRAHVHPTVNQNRVGELDEVDTSLEEREPACVEVARAVRSEKSGVAGSLQQGCKFTPAGLAGLKNGLFVVSANDRDIDAHRFELNDETQNPEAVRTFTDEIAQEVQRIPGPDSDSVDEKRPGGAGAPVDVPDDEPPSILGSVVIPVPATTEEGGTPIPVSIGSKPPLHWSGQSVEPIRAAALRTSNS
jgi:hypothetical protein